VVSGYCSIEGVERNRFAVGVAFSPSPLQRSRVVRAARHEPPTTLKATRRWLWTQCQVPGSWWNPRPAARIAAAGLNWRHWDTVRVPDVQRSCGLSIPLAERNSIGSRRRFRPTYCFQTLTLPALVQGHIESGNNPIRYAANGGRVHQRAASSQ
jgi:hypothetical protein